MSIVGSAYPPDVADLLPRARELAGQLGELPSRNRLMAEFHIGAPKANAVRDALAVNAVAGPVAPVADPGANGHAQVSAPGTGGHAVVPVPAPVVPEARQVASVADPGVRVGPVTRRRMPAWPLALLALPAAVAVWSGWVGLGELAGFGIVHPLPGIADRFSLNTAITLPIGVEAYGAYGLAAWLHPQVPARARRFARWSALGALALGMLGQVAYHLLAAAGASRAPVVVTVLVSCLPVVVLGLGTALAHLLRAEDQP